MLKQRPARLDARSPRTADGAMNEDAARAGFTAEPRRAGSAPRWLLAGWLLLPLLLFAASRRYPDNVTYWLMLQQNRALLGPFLALALFVLLPLRIGPRRLALSP